MAWHDDPNSSRPLLVLTTLLLIWTTLFAGIRLWARWQQQRSWLDVGFAAGYIVAAAQCTATFLAVTRYGFGETGIDAATNANPSSWKKSLFAGEVLYLLCMGISRLATALFFGRLSRERRQRTVGLVLVSLTVAWTVASVVAIALRGDLSAPWLAVGPNWARWLGIETSGLILEMAFLVFSITLVWGLQMPIFKRIRIILIFSARLLLIPLITYRLIRLSPRTYHDSVYDITMVNIFTQLAMHFALFAECLTSLRPFMQTFHEGYDAEASNVNYWGGLAINTSQQYSSNGYTRDSKGKKVKVSSKETPSWRQKSEDDTRLNRSAFSTKIEGARRGGRSGIEKESGEDDIELLQRDRDGRAGIWVQQEMNVEASTEV